MSDLNSRNPIPGFKGYYATECGNIFKGDKLIKPIQAHNGYTRSRLNGRYYYTHRIILLAFKGPSPPNHVARHIDGNPINNTLNDRDWETAKNH